MKANTSVVIALIFFASQANVTAAHAAGNGLIKNDMKTCYGKLNELKKLDHTEFRSLNTKLMSVVQSQASLSASEQYVSQEALSYIRTQQTKTISNTCDQISQELDEVLIKKAMKSLNS